jgi:hypothetical protein
MQETLTECVQFSLASNAYKVHEVTTVISQYISPSEFNMKEEFELKTLQLCKLLKAFDLLIIPEDQNISIFSLCHPQDTGSTLAVKPSTPSTE